MNENDIILQSMNDYLMTRYNYLSLPASFGFTNGVIEAKRKQFNLYIRLIRIGGGLWPKDTLVMARIGFLKERAGHGRDFVKFLYNIAIQHKFKHIGIEFTNENSSAFAQKLGFHHIGGQHYLISISDLIPYLSKHS